MRSVLTKSAVLVPRSFFSAAIDARKIFDEIRDAIAKRVEQRTSLEIEPKVLIMSHQKASEFFGSIETTHLHFLNMSKERKIKRLGV